MFLSPYDTAAGTPHNVVELTTELELANHRGDLVSELVPKNTEIVALISDKEMVDKITAFPHPITYTSSLARNQMFTVTDLRPYANSLTAGNAHKYVVPVKGAVPFNLMRAQLQAVWYKTNGASRLDGIKKYPMAVYVNWITNALDNRLHLDAEAYRKAKVITAIFFESLFLDLTVPRKISDDEAMDLALYISRISFIPTDFVVDTVREVGSYIKDVKEFIEVLKEHGGSLRFKQINVGVFYTALLGSWFGTFLHREVVGVAVEYPPTFFAMVWSSITETTYRDTPIGKLVNKLNKDDVHRIFMAEISDLLTRG